MKTIFPTIKPYLDADGNLYLPKNMKFGGQVEPSLSSREWMVLVYLSTNKDLCSSKELVKEFKNTFIGSDATLCRVRKKLKNKGFL